MTTYAERTELTHLDGTPIFRSREDEQAEAVVLSEIAAAWNCQVHSFGVLSPIDWYAVRYERVVGLIEVKHRSHESTTFDTVFLNVRKWLALVLGSNGMGVPAIFVVQFLDGTFFIPVADIIASRVKIGGCANQVKARSDIEPVIEVPVDMLRPLT